MLGTAATRWYKILAVGALLVYTLLFFLQQTNLVTSDLGRHISNGQVALSAWQAGDWGSFQRLISTNFYSYTESNFPTLMHHWLFGVLVAVVHGLVGFAGLTVLNALVVVSSLFIMLISLLRRTSATVALVTGVVVLPLLASRTEVRPESFSLLFVSVLFWLHTRSESNTLPTPLQLLKFGGAAALISALWVNTHIFFFLGPVFSAILLFDSVWVQRKISRAGLAILLGSSLGIVLTPLGLAGVFAPLTLFGNYGYLIVENMPLWFMIERFGTPLYWYIAGLFVVVVALAVIRGKQLVRTRPSSIFLALLAIVGTVALNRFANVAALLLLPLLVSVLPEKLWKKLIELQDSSASLLTLSIGGVVVFLVVVGSGLFFPNLRNIGIGLTPGSLATSDFLNSQKVPGPIFNNYDIGSYLLYNNKPGRVFVDNRPEAYSSEFLQKTLIAAQEDEEVWKSTLEKYQFESIVFYRHDQTPWAQPFLIRRIQDEDWVPVFVDDYSLVLIKNAPEHAEIIEKHRLPAELFKTSPQ